MDAPLGYLQLLKCTKKGREKIQEHPRGVVLKRLCSRVVSICTQTLVEKATKECKKPYPKSSMNVCVRTTRAGFVGHHNGRDSYYGVNIELDGDPKWCFS